MKYTYIPFLCWLCLVFNIGCCNDEKQDKEKIARRVALLEKTLQSSAQDLEKIGISPVQTKQSDAKAHSIALGNVIKKQQVKLNALYGLLGQAEFNMGLQGKNVTQAIRLLHQRYCQMYAVMKHVIEEKDKYKSQLKCMQKIVIELETASMRQAEEIASQKDLLEKMTKVIDFDDLSKD